MKKNVLLALLAIVLAPATFQVVAYEAQENKAENEAQAESSCGCKKRVIKACTTCPKREKKPCATCPKREKKACPKKCPRVSKCLSCEERKAQEEREAMEAGMNDDLDIVGRAVGTADAAVSGAVDTTRDVTGSALGSRETRENLREERQQRREDRRLDRQDRRDARRSAR